MGSDTKSNSTACAIGLDVGGTKIAGGVVSYPSGQVLAKQVIPTKPTRGGEAVLADAVALAKTLMAQARELKRQVLGLGLGVAELVDPAGNVTSSHTIDWRDRPIRDTFSVLAPTIIESDVRAAALAESMYGAGKSFNLFTYVTVGTGISYCLIQAGQPYTGARGNALILASSPLTTTCPVCNTVLNPVLEAFASGPALVTRYNQRSNRQAGSGEDVQAAVEAGDATAIEVVKTAGQALGTSVGWLVNVLDPEAVIVGGGLGTAGGLYWSSFVESTRRHIWADAGRDLPLIPAALGVDAGFIGAAATIFRQQHQVEEKQDRQK